VTQVRKNNVIQRLCVEIAVLVFHVKTQVFFILFPRCV